MKHRGNCMKIALNLIESVLARIFLLPSVVFSQDLSEKRNSHISVTLLAYQQLKACITHPSELSDSFHEVGHLDTHSVASRTATAGSAQFLVELLPLLFLFLLDFRFAFRLPLLTKFCVLCFSFHVKA